MPPFLDHRRQFTTQESNESRCITKIRWAVEAVNRRIKEFKYFANTVQNSSLMYLQDDLSIVCALINRYRPLIATSKPEDVELEREMRSLITKKNSLEKVNIITLLL
jgi:DNA-binding transcriptional regulator WhiA